MSNTIETIVENLAVRLAAASQRFRYPVALAALLVVLAAGTYTATHVGINTDTTDMLSERLPWRIAYRDFKAAFPFYADNLVVVVDATTPDRAEEAAQALSERLSRATASFSEVFNPRGDAFFAENQFLYLDVPGLEALSNQLSSAQAMLGRLAADPGLLGLLQVISDIREHADGTLPDTAADFVNQISVALTASLAGDQHPMSWQSLFRGDAFEVSPRVIFTAQPRLDYASILPAANSIDALREMVHDLGLDADTSDVTVRVTGGAALGYDELSSVIRGAEQAGVLALIMIAGCLVVGLRSLSLVVATLLALVFGLVLTATFAAAAVGTLNMISVAFAALYVGLGVDFAIHLCLRYRELNATMVRSQAIIEAARHIGPSLTLCALTTAIGFFAFMPTAYRGVAELGLISGVGMFIGLFTSFTVLPALLALLPPPHAVAAAAPAALPATPHRPRHTGAVIAFAIVASLLACAALPFTHFDLNPIHLNDQQAESVLTFNDLARESEDSLYAMSVLVANRADAEALTPRLAALPDVAGVMTADDLVPDDQDEKLAIIEDLNWAYGESLAVATPRALDPATLRELLTRLASPPADLSLTPTLAAALLELSASAQAVLKALDARPPAAAEQLAAQLESKLMHHFAAQIARLRTALQAAPISLDSLPTALRERWIAPDGRYRVEIQPAGDLDQNARMAAYVDAVRAVTGPSVTGTPVINIEASRAVTTAFYQAFAAAGILIAMLLVTIFRKPGEVVIVLVPLLMAGLLTTAITVVLGIPFNFANIIALPLLMGIGVDSAVHILHRHKTESARANSLLRTSTARAVLFSALTTAASFGNLAVSPHAGTASMGIMLSIGLAMTLLCSLVILPALLERYVTASGSLT